MKPLLQAVVRHTCLRCSVRVLPPVSCSYLSATRLETNNKHVARCAASHRRTLCTAGPKGGKIYKSPVKEVEIPNISVAEYMFSQFDKFKDKLAMVNFDTGASFTYTDMTAKSISVASFLTRNGYKKGDVIAYYGINCPEFTILMLACAATGIVLTTANPAYTSGELARHLEHSGSSVLVTVLPLTKPAAEAMNTSSVKDIIVVGEAEGYKSFSLMLEDDGLAFPQNVNINPTEDLMVMPYSSGTTGLPKGVMLTHHNIVSNLCQFKSSYKVTEEDNLLGVLPFFHIYGMVPVMFGALQEGSTLTTLSRFEPESFLTALQKQRITHLHIVPPIILFMAKHPVVSKFDLSSLENVISAAAPLGQALSYEFIDKHKVKLVQGYGMTETSPVIHVDDQHNPDVGTIGKLIANTEAKIIDGEGQVLGPGQEGELCIKGPQVMKGYLHNVQATQEMIDPDGWLHTGDIGYAKDNENFVITDRLKELIKYKGFQVPPAELENLLLKHPAVQDVAVIGMPDDEAGELPRAYIVCQPHAQTSSADIMQYVENHAAPYKRLRGGVEFVKEIPKSASGKILRRILKDQLSSSQT